VQGVELDVVSEGLRLEDRIGVFPSPNALHVLKEKAMRFGI